MECHRCPHSEDVAAGKYLNVGFALTPCGKCELLEFSLRTMPLDEDRPAYVPGADGGVEPTCEMVPFPEEEEVEAAKLPVHVMEEFIVRLLALPDDVRDVVCWRFIGLTYPQIADKQRTTTAGAEARHRRAMRMFPELRQLFILKTARQKMRQGAKTADVGRA